MASFDVSDYILNTDPMFKHDTGDKNYGQLIEWLVNNVGERIPNNVISSFANGSPGWLSDGTLTEGHGWRVICSTTTEYDDDLDETGIQIMSWDLTIDSPELSTLYALTWIK